jgi:hypothetical protein
MTAIIKPKGRVSVTPRMMALSPYELYLEQVGGVSDSIRVKSQGLTYIPAQFGGLKGQRESLRSQVVVQMIDFENS